MKGLLYASIFYLLLYSLQTVQFSYEDSTSTPNIMINPI